MTALWPGAALAACILGIAVGVRLLRSTPQGAASLVRDVGDEAARPSLGRRLLAGAGRRWGPTVRTLMSEQRAALIGHRLDAAGRPGGLDLAGYAARKAGLTALGLAVGVVLLLLTGNPLALVALALGSWLAVDLSLVGAARRRQRQIDRDLPDFLDVLAVTVGAGLGFRTALARVGDEIGGPVGEEVRTALQQMSLGASRRAAFQGLRDRNDSEPLREFTTALLQAEELGSPLGDSLQQIAGDLRRSFAQRARREAAQAAPKVSLIITTVVVPGALVLILVGLFLGSDVDLGVFGGT